MSRRTAVWLARSMLAISVVLAVPSVLSWLVFPAAAGEGPDSPSVLVLVLTYSCTLLAFPTVGALIAARRRDHPVGWLFCLVGVSLGANAAATVYTHIALIERPGSLPAGAEILAITNVLFNVGGMAALLAFLLFPTGRLPSSRWRFAPLLVVLAGTLDALGWTLQPGPLPLSAPVVVENPFGLPGAEPVLGVMRNLGGLLILVSIVVVTSVLVVRFRHAQGIERQQLKWVTYAIGFLASVFTSWFVSNAVGIPQYVVSLVWALFLLSLGLVPVAAGIAIVRYRLFDIDLLINRTVVYALVTAVLGLTYFGLVLLVQFLLRPLTPQTDLAIVVATLGVAILVQPVRRGVQGAVDRRFYRQKYDAVQTVEAFAAVARHEVDLDRLNNALVTIVSETFRPATISLWVRPDARHQPMRHE